jgi:glycosyltransferase involved in cell wall biosynthesis
VAFDVRTSLSQVVTTKRSQLRVNYIAHLDPFVYSGGAEITYRQLILHGRARGHDIRVSARRWGPASLVFGQRLDFHEKPDLTLLVDVWNVPERPWRLDTALLERVVEGGRYVHMESAWVDICRRPYFPCGGDPSCCPDACGHQRARWIYGNALGAAFWSPLHRDRAVSVLGDGIIKRSVIIRPCIDTSVFYNRQRTRDIEYLYVGVIADYKGYQNLKRRFGDREDFVFVGKNITGEQLFGKDLGSVPHQQLAELYNRARNFVHLPEWVEAQGRTVVEAALCGCNLITNDRVGATSFDFDIGNPQEIQRSPDVFWDDIESFV